MDQSGNFYENSEIVSIYALIGETNGECTSGCANQYNMKSVWVDKRFSEDNLPYWQYNIGLIELEKKIKKKHYFKTKITKNPKVAATKLVMAGHGYTWPVAWAGSWRRRDRIMVQDTFLYETEGKCRKPTVLYGKSLEGGYDNYKSVFCFKREAMKQNDIPYYYGWWGHILLRVYGKKKNKVALVGIKNYGWNGSFENWALRVNHWKKKINQKLKNKNGAWTKTYPVSR